MTAAADSFTIRGETFHVASWPARIGAKVIDLVFCYAVMFVSIRVLLALLPDLWFAVAISLVVFAAVAWWFTSDGMLGGAGLGKRMLGLRLIHRRHGSRPSAGQAAIRQMKYSMFLSLWGLLMHAQDEKHGTAQPDEFVTVTKPPPAGDPAAITPPPPRRALNVEALGEFLTDKYSHEKPQEHRPPPQK